MMSLKMRRAYLKMPSPAKPNQLVSALIGVAALTAQRKNGDYNYSGDTVIFTLSLCNIAGPDIHSSMTS
jgi:hypothetical protein